MSIATPPSTTLSAPPSPTELPTSILPPEEDTSDEEPTMLTPNSKRIIKTTETLITPIFIRPKPIYVIVATSLNPPMGIGHGGKLPWPGIKADMTFFKQITSHVPVDESARTRTLNAVVMGRKTWESIPTKFRPLAGRLNVIITRGSSLELGRRILEEMKSNAQGTASLEWKMHQLPPTFVRAKSKSKTAEGATTILMPPLSSPSPKQPPSPILISQSLTSALSLLSSAAPVFLSTSPVAAPTSTPTEPSPSDSLSIHKIFCIGGAEIYLQVLALSSHSPPSPSTPTGPGSGTDTEGEGGPDPNKGGRHFDVRILQTQIRKPAGQTAAAMTAQDPNQRRKSRVEAPDFECDTFFPDLLPSTGSGVKSTKWRPATQEKVLEWIGDDIDLPQHAGRRKQSIEDEVFEGEEEESEEDEEDEENDGGQEVEGKELWLKDDKAGVEIRVVGWQRR